MARPVVCPVELSANERGVLERICAKGRAPASQTRKARILLLTDEGREGGPLNDEKIAETLSVATRTITRLRERFSAVRMEALARKVHSAYKPRKLTGEEEARLITLACSEPPKGHTRWSLRLLADRLVFLNIVDSIAPETIRKTLKKTNSSHGKSSAGSSRQGKTPRSSAPWRTSSPSIQGRSTKKGR